MLTQTSVVFVLSGLAFAAQPAGAQAVDPSAAPPELEVVREPDPETRMIKVDGYALRVLTAGLDRRETGAPVVIFENGGNAPVESWGTVVSRVAAFAPVIAYDRSTDGLSEWDGEIATPARVVATLRALLDTLGVAPPYVLVGWSWGGDLIRHHAGLHPEGIAGLVYVDPSVHSPASTLRALEAVGAGENEFDAFLSYIEQATADLPPAHQAAIQPVYDLYVQRLEQEFDPAPGVPTAVILAGRYQPPSAAELEAMRDAVYDRLAHHHASLRDRISRLSEWVLAAPEGQLVVATSSGHAIQIEEPELVVDAIRRVLFPDLARQLRHAMESGGFQALAAAYESIKRRYPADRLDETVLNRLGYELLADGLVVEAVAVFELNVAEYPDAWNPYDSLGDAYMAAGERERAIASYRKSLELNPVSPSARKLRELGG